MNQGVKEGKKAKTTKTKVASSKELELASEDIKKAALILRALNHQLRQRILLFIHKNERTTVTLIYTKLRLEQSVTSQHLAVMRKAGFLYTEREGQNILYSVNYKRLTDVQNFAKAMIG
jgi:DNA-binding transcriptional ArsR family regulator